MTHTYLWAKTPATKESTEYLPVLHHLLDVGAVALKLLELEGPALQRLYQKDLGLENLAAVLAWVPALVALHDIGKAYPTFQLKWSHWDEVLRLQADLPAKPREPDIPHGVVSEAILGKDLAEHLGFPPDLATRIADAVGRHHGFKCDESSLSKAEYCIEDLDQSWRKVQLELLDAVMSAFGCLDFAIPTSEDLGGAGLMRLAGLVSFVDWIGSNQFQFGHPRKYPADLAESLERAQRALAALAWPLNPKVLKSFDQLFGFSPRELQAAVIDSLQDVQGPFLLLLEAPMGEGKTEAALYAHHLVQSRGLYFALPTQATGNAMFVRVADQFLGRLGQTGVDLQLLHGCALLNEDYERLKLAVNVQEDEMESVVAREWFSHSKRALLSPNGVGTIDQALLSVLIVKHHFVRMWGLGRRTIIFDEIHAYECYTQELLIRLVHWLRAMDCNVVLLSATLPSQVRRKLVSAFGHQEPEGEQVYPRLTHVSDAGVSFKSFPVRASQFRLGVCPAEIPLLADHLLQLAQSGGAVGCIVNTVGRAQALYRQLRQLRADQPVLLLHARFPLRDRLAREQELLSRVGKGSLPEQRNLIVVATQVAEQSLDLDFDVLVTDLAPIDLVLQRAGRMHRHQGRFRPAAHSQAVLYVAGLGQAGQLPRLREFTWSYVYSPYILYRSAHLLQMRLGTALQLPQDLQGAQSLVEQCYCDQPLGWPQEWEEKMEKSRRKFERDLEEQEREAYNCVLPLPERLLHVTLGDRKWSEEDEATQKRLVAQTRLGTPSLSLLLYEESSGKHFTLRGQPLDFSPKVSLASAKLWMQEVIKIATPPVVSRLRPELEKSPWKKNSLLRYVLPLEVRDRTCEVGEYVLEMQEELGLIVERAAKRGEGQNESD